ncbi:MAG: regulatory protein GemA [Azoarcus sp.]|jgi:phage gp16-like protein|nr:regulatory protein GemA [Azoarcus sp.]
MMNKTTFTRQIKLIHVARRELGIDDDAWHVLLRQKFGVESSVDLDEAGFYRLIEHLKKCGFKVRHPNRKPGGGAPSRPLAGAAQARRGEPAKIRAIWLFMYRELSLVKDPSETALAAYVCRITGVEALQWLDEKQTVRVIETLKKWAERVFYDKLIARAPETLAIAVVRGIANETISDAHAMIHCASASKTKEGKTGTFAACFGAWRALDACEILPG